MTSFSYREFTDSLITQNLTLCQVAEFLYNMDVYDTNMDPITSSLHYENSKKSLNLTQLSQYTRSTKFYHRFILTLG